MTDLALAIAHAEGFGLPDAIPTKANNPGDLVLGDHGLGVLGAGITRFETPAEGWAALDGECTLIKNEEPAVHRLPVSHVYSCDMNLSEMADHWTLTDRDAWARNVAAWFVQHGRPNTTVSTPLKHLL